MFYQYLEFYMQGVGRKSDTLYNKIADYDSPQDHREKKSHP